MLRICLFASMEISSPARRWRPGTGVGGEIEVAWGPGTRPSPDLPVDVGDAPEAGDHPDYSQTVRLWQGVVHWRSGIGLHTLDHAS
jgi:hypothetical protein